MGAECGEFLLADADLALVHVMGLVVGQAVQHAGHIAGVEGGEIAFDGVVHETSVGSPHFSFSLATIWSRV